MSELKTGDFDPFMTAIISNRIEGIIREMSNTLLRAARSSVISGARDFSCSICTGDNELLASAEGLPVHIFSSHMQTKTMTDYHGDDLKEGDCYLHNDPYSGNSHPGDWAFLAPVFVEGEHLFTVVAKAHQADIGNAQPSTYMPTAKDVYEEGSLLFPAVRIQRDYKMVDDVVRMCRLRIRVPDQWYGDFLAGIGSARIGEKRLKELCAKYGKDRIKAFIRDWMDYSEQRMIQAIRKFPKKTLYAESAHDPLAGILPDPVPFKLRIDLDPDNAMIEADLRDNPDQIESGFNMSIACSTAAAFAGIFNAIGDEVPRNSGSFRRLNIHLRKGSVFNPKFPASCSLATTNFSDRLINMAQSAFATLGDGFGLAEGGVGTGAGVGVVAGRDGRAGGDPYVTQLISCAAGGPGSPSADGWMNYIVPAGAGMLYRDSVEVLEVKIPMQVGYTKLLPGTAGAGRYRGAPVVEIAYGPRDLPMEARWACDGTLFPSKGVIGGHDGVLSQHWKVSANGLEEELPNIVMVELQKGEYVRGHGCAGGGYGDPRERDPARVLKDVLEGYETLERARDVYGVAFTGSVEDDDLAVDAERTAELRQKVPA